MNKLATNAQAIFKVLYPHSALHIKFASIFEFLSDNPENAQYLKGMSIDDESFIVRMCHRFVKGRKEFPPSIPDTIPDTMIDVVLENYYSVARDELRTASVYHRYSMGAENIIGNLLEFYIASEAEKNDWVWCSGQFVKAIDFLRKQPSGSNKWEMLQVKNRDNSENSSSSAVRNGTEIKKWFRTFSRTGNTNWENYPDVTLKQRLSEEGFICFVKAYLKRLTPTEV